MKSATLLPFLLASILSAQAPVENPVAAADARPAAVVPGSDRRMPRDFGVGVMETYEVYAGAMAPLVSDTSYALSGPNRYLAGGTGHWFIAPVTLPSGALAIAVELDGCDTTATGVAQLALNKCGPHGTAGCTALATASTGASETPGCGFFYTALPGGPETLDQTSSGYHLLVYLSETGPSLQFTTARLYWQRQVSPAPATATFGDVPPSHPFFRVIEAFAASGITTGCGGGNFCPDGVVTRQEVAKFLARALGLSYSF